MNTNWDTDVVPGTLDAAVLTDVTTGSRTVSFDTAAPGTVLQIDLNQTSAAINQLEFLTPATITNAITLGAAAGTEEIRLTPPTTGGILLTTPGGITLNSGGRLTMQANFAGSTQITSNITGNVVISGGTLNVTPSGFLTSANIRIINGSLTMNSGTLSIDPSSTPTAAQSRLQVTGFNITGGAINRGTGTASQAQLVSIGATNTLSPTTFDKGVSIALQSGNQTATISTNIGELLLRNTGAASTTTTKTVTLTGIATTGRITLGTGTANAVSNLVMASNLTVTNDPSNSSMPIGGFGTVNSLGILGIDTAGFTLDLTAARAASGSLTWTPNLQAVSGSTTHTTHWNLTNSGTAFQGGIKVGNINFTAATQVNVGPGVAIELTGGNSTVINAGGGGTWDAASLLRYSGTAASATPATLTSNRVIGDLLLSTTSTSTGNGVLQLLATSVADAYQNDITLRMGTLVVGANSLLGGVAASPIKLGDGTTAVGARIILQFGDGITIDRAIDVTAPLGTGANASSQRPRIQLSGVAAAGMVSSDITYGLAGPGTPQILELTAPDPAAVLTVSGKIQAPVGQTNAGRVLINGGNSGKGTVKLANINSNFTAGVTVVDGTLLIPADVTPTGNSVIGTNGTLNIADGGTPEATTISVLLDGPLTFSRVASVNRNSTTTGTQYTAVLGMTATASGAATWSGNIISATDPIVKKLRLTAPASGSVLFSGSIAANSDAVGSVSIEKVGAGTVELTGINTYDGDTTVSEGVLAVNGSALPDANKLVIDGGKVAPSGVEIVDSLFFGIVEQATGTWGASGSGATHIDNDRFSGSLGVVEVSAVVLDPYTTWINSPAFNTPPLSAADKLPTADPDLDGISNLLEFSLGGNPVVSSQSILPTQATVGPNVVLSYQRSDESESPATTQVGQWSTDLSAWTDVTPVLVSENGALPDDMTVSVPTANAAAGRLFVRLKVLKP